MSRNKSIQIQIKTLAELKELNKAIKGIDNLGDEISETARETNNANEKWNGLGHSLKQGAGLGIASIAVQKLGQSLRTASEFLKDSTRLYGIQQKAELGLASAIRTNGGQVERMLPRYKALASAIQDVTIHGDEETLSLIATATQMGITSDKMEETIKGAIGLSKAFELDLKTATRAAASALQGNTSILTRYIPELRNASTEAEKMAIVQAGMANGFEQATAEAEGLTERQVQLANAFGDLKESIGAASAPAVLAGVEALTAKIKELTRTKETVLAETDMAGLDQMLDATSPEAFAQGLETVREQIAAITAEQKENQGWVDLATQGKLVASHRNQVLQAERTRKLQKEHLQEQLRINEAKEGEVIAAAKAREDAQAATKAEAEKAAQLAYQKELQAGLNQAEADHALLTADTAGKIDILTKKLEEARAAEASAAAEQDANKQIAQRKTILQIERQISTLRATLAKGEKPAVGGDDDDDSDDNSDLKDRIALAQQLTEEERRLQQLKANGATHSKTEKDLAGQDQEVFYDRGRKLGTQDQIDQRNQRFGGDPSASRFDDPAPVSSQSPPPTPAPQQPSPSPQPSTPAQSPASQPIDTAPIAAAVDAIQIDNAPVLAALSGLEQRLSQTFSNLSSRIDEIGGN